MRDLRHQLAGDRILLMLDFQRATLLMKCTGLSKEQLAQRTAASSLTLAGLLKHLALVEDYWFPSSSWADEPARSWRAVDLDADPDWEFRTALEDDPDGCGRSTPTPARPRARSVGGLAWTTCGAPRRDGAQFNLRWVLVHMIEETARHNGHADLLREAIDGTTGERVAAACQDARPMCHHPAAADRAAGPRAPRGRPLPRALARVTLPRTFGGQVAGQALVAAVQTVDPEPHGALAALLLPAPRRPAPSPIVYSVDRARDGRSFTTRRVVAIQHGHPIYTMSADFQMPRAEGSTTRTPCRPAPDPESCPPRGAGAVGPGAQMSGAAWAAVDVRRAGPRPGTDPASHQQVWMRAVDERIPDEPLLHDCVLTYLSDMTLLGAALRPHPEHRRDEVQMASLDHAMWFHRPFRCDEWLLYDQFSPSTSGGRGLTFGHIFTREGVLAATVAQEGLMRLRPPERLRRPLEAAAFLPAVLARALRAGAAVLVRPGGRGGGSRRPRASPSRPAAPGPRGRSR